MFLELLTKEIRHYQDSIDILFAQLETPTLPPQQAKEIAARMRRMSFDVVSILEQAESVEDKSYQLIEQ
jgi:hypothetical protein